MQSVYMLLKTSLIFNFFDATVQGLVKMDLTKKNTVLINLITSYWIQKFFRDTLGFEISRLKMIIRNKGLGLPYHFDIYPWYTRYMYRILTVLLYYSHSTILSKL